MFAGFEERIAEALGDLEDGSGDGSLMESGADSGEGSGASGDDD